MSMSAIERVVVENMRKNVRRLRDEVVGAITPSSPGGTTTMIVDKELLAQMAASAAAQAALVTQSIADSAATSAEQAVLDLGLWHELFNLKIEQCTNLKKVLDDARELEFVTKTSTGSRALGYRGDLASRISSLEEARKDADKLKAKLSSASDEAVLEKYNAFHPKARIQAEKAAKLMEAASRAFEEMIEFEAIKAWVKKHPDSASKKLGWFLKGVDQAINGFEVAADYAEIGGVAGAPACAGAMKAGKALIDKAVKSADANRQVGNYREKYVKGSIVKEHQDNPLLMAKMLAGKLKDEVDLALALVEPIAAEVPGWDTISKLIKKSVAAYLKERMDKAKDLLGLTVNKKELPELIVKNLKDGLEDNIFSVLEPHKLMLDAAVGALFDKILAKIMEALPIDPAQIIDGAKLTSEVEKSVRSFLTSYHVKGQAQRPEFDFPRPETDDAGNPIEAVLSAIRKDDAGRPYQLVKVGGEVGALYRPGNEFVSATDGGPVSEQEAFLISGVPAKDSRDRVVLEVAVEKGMVRHPEKATAAFWARIGDLWGYLETTKPHHFTPAKPDESAFADWSSRWVDFDGYWASSRQGKPGDKVRGHWYRPLPNQQYYLFDPVSGGRAWARGIDLTSNGAGPRFNIQALLGGRDLDDYPFGPL